MINLFLSASVPLPSRDAQFFESADNLAIRNSVKALISTCVPKATIVFGGHPAITPLISVVLSRMPDLYRNRVKLYVSNFFEPEFVPEISDFLNIIRTENINSNRNDSLSVMRERMIGETQFDAGIFIGGMEGVLDEYQAFKNAHGNAKLYPISSTGAAAKMLYEQDNHTYSELNTEYTYATLFREILKELRK